MSVKEADHAQGTPLPPPRGGVFREERDVAKFIVEIPDDIRDDLWLVSRAVLEAVEPGASGHCLFRAWDNDAGIVSRYEHVRLGVKVSREE